MSAAIDFERLRACSTNDGIQILQGAFEKQFVSQMEAKYHDLNGDAITCFLKAASEIVKKYQAGDIPPERLSSYLCERTEWRVLDWLRKQCERETLGDRDSSIHASDDFQPVLIAQRNEILRFIQEFVAINLSPTEREVFEQLYYEGHSIQEAADRSGKSAECIRTTKHRALVRLWNALIKKGLVEDRDHDPFND